MNRRVFVAALFAAAAFTAAPATAQTLAGTWEITSETQRGSQTQTVTLAQDGMALTGTITMTMGGRRGGGGGGAQSIEITDGHVDGASFSFTMNLEFNGNSIVQSYSGTFEGDAMTGQIEGGRGGARPFTGKRGSE